MGSIKVDKKKKVLLLNGWQQIFHFYYAPILFVGFAIVIVLFNPSFISLWLLCVFIFLTLVFFFAQKRLKSLKELKVSCTQEQLKKAFENTAKIRGWEIELIDNTTMLAFDKDPFNFYGGGDLIIVIPTDLGFLMTTTPDPREMVSPFFTPHKKRNKNEFVNQLIGVIKGQNITTSIDQMEKEWTFKKLMVRLIAYSFCLFLIVFGFYMIFNPVNWKSKGAGTGAILAACLYLYVDIKLIIKKSKTNSRHN